MGWWIRISIVIVACAITAGANAGPLDQFAGRWAGWGRLSLAGGNTEKLKCVTTYRVKSGGLSADQNFRCASAGYRFDAVVTLNVSSNKVSGEWRERIFSAGGPLSGTLKSGNMRLRLRSETFVASVDVKSRKCTQSIVIKPRGGDIDIQSISVSLKRC